MLGEVSAAGGRGLSRHKVAAISLCRPLILAGDVGRVLLPSDAQDQGQDKVPAPEERSVAQVWSVHRIERLVQMVRGAGSAADP